MIMAFLMIYSTAGVTSGKKKFVATSNGGHFEILNTASIDLRYKKIDRNYTKKSIFHGDDVIDGPLYSCLGEVGSRNKLQGQCLVNKYKSPRRLGYTCLKKISINNAFRHRMSKVNFTGLLGDLGI